MEEIYKDIPGYDGLYQVSNMGNVKILNYRSTNKERILKANTSSNAYLRVCLYKNGKQKVIAIHQLVAMAFLGHIPNGKSIVVDHIDNNKLNNHVSNLQIVSHRINTTKDRNNPGITFHKSTGKWQVRIQHNNIKTYLGVYTDKQDALDAYQKALNELNV
jgi:hypothetical protein